MMVCSLGGFVVSARHRMQLIAFRAATRDLRRVELALLDGETGVQSYLLTRRAESLLPYFTALATLDANGAALLSVLDRPAADAAEAQAVGSRIGELRRTWAAVVSLAQAQAPAPAQAVLDRQQRQLFEEARALLTGSIARRDGMADKADARLAGQRQVLFGVDLGTAVVTIAALLYFFAGLMRESRRREAVAAESALATRRAERLFGMASTLQSAADRDDALRVLCATVTDVLPGYSGLLYMLDTSQDRLERSAGWGPGDGLPAPDHIVPRTCWALKCGRPHLNGAPGSELKCEHLGERHAHLLELPLAARGQVFGLVVIGLGEHAEPAALPAILPVAAALADAISLALSSIALRDQLRNQALRDSLTGLYNRRFLDEMLEHLSLDARRRQTPLSAIMIDLDYFKQLNDQFGHATGDAMLRAVASVVVHALRATDIACRYGGEELAVLLPDCPLDMAMFKAEQLRARIAEVASGPGGASVTASLGVAAIPETSDTPASLIASADAALYQAKLKGRNRVVQAEDQIARDATRLSLQAASEAASASLT
jgi:diguanylate cyclase (GGDEF)-like protein